MASFENDSELCASSSIVNTNGYKLYCRYWEPKETPRAAVFIAHGLGEHSQYYHPLASALKEIQCFVFAHDHAGHGRSEGPKASVDNMDKFVQDVFQHTDLIKEKYPGIPIFYIGHSMGGTIGAKAVLKRPHYFKGVVFSGPGISISQGTASSLSIKVCKVIGWMFPSFPVSKVDYNFGTRNEEIIKIKENDPFSLHGHINAGITRALITAMEVIQGNFQAIDCPLLILHGEDDKICNIEGSRMLYEKCSSTDKTFKTYPKAYHSLLQEPEGIKEQVIESTSKWIEERIE